MSEQENDQNQTDKNAIGEMAWIDLTVKDAPKVRDFYQNVVGWKPEAVSMGDYDDFAMNSPETGEAVTGVCHAQGENADLPPVWMPYFLVADLDKSVEQVTSQGGELVTKIKAMGQHRYVIIKDPAGAYCALYAQQ